MASTVSALLPEIPAPGFSFANFQRNLALAEDGLKYSKVLKTGTTICGAIFDEGVVVAADTRATAGSIVADKKTTKIHDVAKNMVFCGAGTSGDLDGLEKLIISHLELHRLNSGKEVPICVALTKMAQHLFRYQGYLGCAVVLGGVDRFGFHLNTVHPHGSVSTHKFAAMGSGSLAAMSILETHYRENMPIEEAKLMVRNAILAGIENDLASGNSIDICILRKGSKEYLRDYEVPKAAIPVPKHLVYKFPPGSVGVLDSVVKFEEVHEEGVGERHIDPDGFMETS